jgi:hypothetical protein
MTKAWGIYRDLWLRFPVRFCVVAIALLLVSIVGLPPDWSNLLPYGGTNDHLPFWQSICGLVGIILLCPAVSLVIPTIENIRNGPKPPPTISDRLSAIRESLRRTGNVLRELEDEIADRVELLEQRQGELEDFENMSDPVRRAALERILARQNKGSVRQFWWGVVFGFIVNLMSSYIWDLIHN